MVKRDDNKHPVKDTVIIIICITIVLSQIIARIARDGFSSIGDLIEQTILIMLAFVGLLEIFHYVGWDIFVPSFMLTKEKDELQECMNEVINHSMDDILKKALERYYFEEKNFIRNNSKDNISYVMSQLGITAEQFEHICFELAKMRCLPLKNLDDAREKIKQFIRCKDPFVVDLNGIDAAKCTYSRVRYYLNFNDAIYFTNTCRELVSIMQMLICEKINVSDFDKIIIPYDSNFVLGVELGKQLGKSAVHMRQNRGRIEREKCWDGDLNDGDRVIIVHDVLVTSDQIMHTLSKLPPTCGVKGLFCFAVRKEWAGLKNLTERNIRVERILDLNDNDIETIINS